MIQRRIGYLLIILGSFVFYGAYQKWFSWIVLLTVLLLPLFSLLLSLWPMFTAKLKFRIKDCVPQTRNEELRVEIRCPVPAPPVKYKIRVTKPNTGESWFLQPGDRLPTEHCGALIIQPYHAKVYDYLGLFRMNLRNPSGQVLRVMPPPLEIPIPHVLTRYFSRAWRPKHGGGYAENHEIRPYRPGDSLNLVHWKLSAKTDDLLLREPMEAEQGSLRLTMELNGTPDELDRKFGRLLYLGNWLLNRQTPFELTVLTGNGSMMWLIEERWFFRKCIDILLIAPFAADNSVTEQNETGQWEYFIEGDADEE